MKRPIPVIHLLRKNKAILVVALAAAVSANALAIQIVEGGDGATIYAKVSKKEMTRLSVDHGRVASLRVRQSELSVDPDEETGQLFLTVPDGVKAKHIKPINAFLTTGAGRTYTLILQVVDTPAESIVIKEPRPRQAARSNDFKSTSYDRAVRRLVAVMSQAPMVLDEREFYRKGVSVVALDQLNLAPGASTRLYVIRDKTHNE